jgi:exopolyphosphatase/guanosine-5'-triphosphate,3'-diphosphate pyrophosphatase
MVAYTRLIAVVEIGSTGIRAVIADIDENRRWRLRDKAGKPVALGRDVFTSKQISRESLWECILVLRNFRELLKSWGIAGRDIHVIATSALRAARNRDIFMDRVRQETGFLIHIVEGIEENRLMYLAVRFALKEDLPQFWQADAMIIEIGGGSTEILLLRQGNMVATHSLRFGTLLIDRIARSSAGSLRSQERYLSETVRNTAEFLNAEMELARIKTFVMAGTDAQYLAPQIGRELNAQCGIIDRDAFIQFVDTIRYYSPDECVKKLRVPASDSAGFIPGNLVYKLFLERTAAQQVAVPYVSIREGYLIDLAMGVDPELQDDFFSQTIASAIHLGRKYHFDEAHHRHVAALCLKLFDALIPLHGMSRRERLLLEVAATLHDIGMYIRGSGHHKHGQYVVANSEIFGIYGDELNMVANIVRYHRGALPAQTDIDFLTLQREERILVMKMAALLRVADALDRSHTQQIKEIQVERKSEILALHTGGGFDLSTERIGLEEKADMFQDIFGFKVVLT